MSPPRSPLSDEERRIVLSLARRAIEETVCQDRIPETPVAVGALTERRGAFVTLYVSGKLRGCIGQVSPNVSLAETIVQCAILAAQEDPRFPPIQPDEVSQMEIEVSLLSEPEPCKPEDIVVGQHGILIAGESHRGLLLPQVARERGWDRWRFLEETCHKAGLPRDAWKDPAVQILAFTAEVFSESSARTSS